MARRTDGATPAPSSLPAGPFLAGLAELEREMAGRGPAWLGELRRNEAARFRRLGFPSTRHEQWKTTSLAPIAGTSFLPAGRGMAGLALSDLPEVARLELGGVRLSFVNGRFAPELSSTRDLPGAVWVGSLTEALESIPERVRPHLAPEEAGDHPAFRALNGALMEDGAVILVPEGTEIEQPIHLLFCSSANGRPFTSQPRNLIGAGPSSRLRIVETYLGVGDGVYLTNAVTSFDLGADAAVEHCRLQLESGSAFHVSELTSRQGRDSRFVTHGIDLGARLARHDIRSVLDGEGASCRLNGLYHTQDSQHVDNHTVLDHARPHGSSRELYKGILEGTSRTVFNGRIVVRPDAQKTDAIQTNPNLLLSDKALAHTRPQLEIYANDVKCTHGATVGRLDEDAIFYLRSRAIGLDQARNLLINSFAAEVLDQIGIEPVRAHLTRTVAQRLSARH